MRILAVCCFALWLLALAASCSAKAVAPGGGYDYYDYYDYGGYPYYYDNYYSGDYGRNVSGGYYYGEPGYIMPEEPYLPGPLPDEDYIVRLVSEVGAEVLDPLAFGIDFQLVALEEERTTVPAEQFSFASTNVRYNLNDDEPDIALRSSADRLALAVYHFAPVAAGDWLSSITIGDQSELTAPEGRGFYLGWRSRPGEEYTWYGPYTAHARWRLFPPPELTRRPTMSSLAVLTIGGDMLDLRSFVVEVLPFDEAEEHYRWMHDDYRGSYDLERERYELEWERLRLQEEWQRLQYERYLLRQREREQDDEPDTPAGPRNPRLIEATETGRTVPARHDLKPHRD